MKEKGTYEHGSKAELGLQQNLKQFLLLVIVNAFVGGMVGMERSIFPEFAELEFGVKSRTAILSFIIAFGFTKALANYYAGRYANSFGRRKLLILGWLFAIPIPFILIYSGAWAWVVFANILLGVNQGLCWSSTVLMKIDLVGPKNRGLAMGLNEFAGYLAVGLLAFLTGYIADRYGIRPYPFYLGIFLAFGGLLLSLIWVKDTRQFVQRESEVDKNQELSNVFRETLFNNPTLSSVSQAGMINNLNDGMIWGLLPIFLFSLDFNAQDIGIIAAIYPTVWGLGQLFTGKMADHYSRKRMLFYGMLLQGIAIFLIPLGDAFWFLASLSLIIGLGTALVYPTFLTVIASNTSPDQRAESIGVFRLWRDLGYAIGAIISGITADLLGVEYAIILIALPTIMSAIIIKVRMPEPKL